ncbi:reverse transcriptase [Cucumis melo var. makuwa]|uniref:Reverse transcriptase n=1 Tax=Cucumis melo var. makuwa TaxID=1194695 RepID=A0A5A7ULZ0_CUCMM|nr:reverse transcriptase [Cucumis melo var. makuwa]TYK20400.1 reverse transcriptase [Cucumis melo var. makuwa]
MKGVAVTSKNTSDKGKDVVLTEKEIPSPRTSAARLMVVEESTVEIFDRMGSLEAIMERLARRLEEALMAIPIKAFLDWIKNVESFFEYMETTEDKKVKMVALKLKLGASAWWDQI